MQYNRVLGFRWYPHPTSRPLLLEMHLVQSPQIDILVSHPSAQFFLCAVCLFGSPLASIGRGFRNRKSSCRNRRWHWRTPRGTPYSFSIHADSVLPSQRFTFIPASLGLPRNTRLIS